MNVDEQRMMDYYDKLMDQIYLQYHVHPTNLERIPLSEAELGELSYYQAMAQAFGDEYCAAFVKRKKKKVYSMTDEKHSNGLLRKKYR